MISQLCGLRNGHCALVADQVSLFGKKSVHDRAGQDLDWRFIKVEKAGFADRCETFHNLSFCESGARMHAA